MRIIALDKEGVGAKKPWGCGRLSISDV